MKASRAAGLEVYRTEIHPDGRIVIYHQGETEESWEEFKDRQSAENEINARVYTSLGLDTGLTAQERLRQKLEAMRKAHDEEKERRRVEKREKREAIKAGLEMPEIFTPRTLAAKWGCSEKHVRNLAQQGKLVSFSLGGKLIRIRREEVEAYEARQAQASSGEG